MVSVSIGERVAIARRRRGLSQAVLANLIGRSESWLSQVERGVRSVDRLPVLMDLAEVLHVEVEALLGRPWKLAPNGTSSPDELSEVRHYLNGYAHLVGLAKLSHLTILSQRRRVSDIDEVSTGGRPTLDRSTNFAADASVALSLASRMTRPVMIPMDGGCAGHGST
jgi:transcriptional regulator with XRE-family HTH domain